MERLAAHGDGLIRPGGPAVMLAGLLFAAAESRSAVLLALMPGGFLKAESRPQLLVGIPCVLIVTEWRQTFTPPIALCKSYRTVAQLQV